MAAPPPCSLKTDGFIGRCSACVYVLRQCDVDRKIKRTYRSLGEGPRGLDNGRIGRFAATLARERATKCQLKGRLQRGAQGGEGGVEGGCFGSVEFGLSPPNFGAERGAEPVDADD
ncbi:hypothetical protein OIDMADRAFT_61756 [Oidiodendron maius Zn]|uniref:Uncharacterized protein n=1 Tax=Oidiodendron maius (strain Zn) TaxID=913774 RepID=A0A0C3GPD1_OIDMZ|nr:hypothetical protein OIDMADRAFT_61756 [Oidiodendron maius Zn]